MTPQGRSVDTTPEAAQVYQAAYASLSGADRVERSMEMAEEVKEITLAGIAYRREPGGDRADRSSLTVDCRTAVLLSGFMPRLSEFYEIAIYMYFSDHNPPHFHALYAKHEALFRIEDGAVLRGELPRTASRLVREWIDLHRRELVENWERAQKPAALVPIDPLD